MWISTFSHKNVSLSNTLTLPLVLPLSFSLKLEQMLQIFFLTPTTVFLNWLCLTFTSHLRFHISSHGLTDVHIWIRNEGRRGWKVSKGVGKTPVQSVLTSGLMKFALACLTSHHQGTSSAPCWWELWPAATALLQEISVRLCDLSDF